MITLYGHEVSADCYKVRVLLNLLELDFDSISLDEYEAEDGGVGPVIALVDGRSEPPAVTHEPIAALLHLCQTYGTGSSLLGGTSASRRARILDWVLWSRTLAGSAGASRRHVSFGERVDIVSARTEAHGLLRQLDRHLWFGEQQGEDFLAGEFTLADIACFGDVVLSEEGGIERQDYPAVRRWCDRVKRVPGLPLMAGMFPAGEARTA